MRVQWLGVVSLLVLGLARASDDMEIFIEDSSPTSTTQDATSPSTSNGGSSTSNGGNTDATSSPGSPITTVSDTTTTKGPTESPTTGPSTESLPSQSTVSTESTLSQSTVSSIPEGSTTTVEVKSTVAPTTPTTTPIPVPVKKAAMEMVCSNGRCKYTLKVPRLSKTFMATQQSNYDGDYNKFVTEQASFNNLEKDSTLSDIQTKFEELNNNVQNAINQLNTIQAALARIPSNGQSTNTSAVRMSNYITLLRGQTDTCLYESCLIPVTTTPTTTVPPTTESPPPNPCTAEIDPCNGQASNCTVDPSNKAKCGVCYGNLADFQMCATSNCTAPGYSRVQDLKTGDFSYFVSPGFRIDADPDDPPVKYGASLNCEWQLRLQPGKILQLSSEHTTSPFAMMDSDAIVALKSGNFQYNIQSTTPLKKVNQALQLCVDPVTRFTLTTGANPNGYFSAKLVNADPPS